MNKMYCTLRVNGESCPVTNLLDIDGDELSEDDTLDMACTAVAQLPDGKYLAAEITLADLWPLS